MLHTHSAVKAAQLACNTRVSGMLTYRSKIKQHPHSVGKNETSEPDGDPEAEKKGWQR